MSKNKPNRPVAKPLFAKPISQPKSQSQQSNSNQKLTYLHDKFSEFYFKNDHASALPFALEALKIVPKNVTLLSDTATCYIYLNDFENGIKYAKQVIHLDPNHINAYDALAHAYGELKDGQNHTDKIAQYGRKALELRDEKYGNNPSLNYQPITLPTLPSTATKAHNIISFSLFGALPKYCETAVLNAQVAEDIYPNWTCRFYVDDSVPNHIKQRLTSHHAQVYEIKEVQQSWQKNNPDFEGDFTHIPQTLWRFLALDDPSVHRAIFRDADSLIGEREALAVDEWVQNDNYFHMMRDAHTHTELVLAGMWGAVTGVLTQERSFAQQIVDYMQHFGNQNRHFADQFFLRDTQWATLKTSLMQHDSQFGFLDAKPFPPVPQAVIDKHHAMYGKNIRIGSNISGGYFETLVTANDGEIVTWKITDEAGSVIGDYQTPAKDGKITVFFPRMLLEKINDKTLKIIV